jgi:hypothetical protein
MSEKVIETGGSPNRVALSVGFQFDRPTPAWVTSLLVKFGRNPYGQPLYRVVWSEGRLEHVLIAEGKYSWQQTYPGTQRWILEKWLPTSCSREEWYRQFGSPDGGCYLGPYLEHGDYHCCYKLEFRGEFMPLTLAVVEYYTRLIEAGREATAVQRKYAQEQRVAREKREWENRCDAVFDDAQVPFGASTVMSGYGGKTTRVMPEDVMLTSVDRLPAWVPRTPGFRQV